MTEVIALVYDDTYKSALELALANSKRTHAIFNEFVSLYEYWKKHLETLGANPKPDQLTPRLFLCDWRFLRSVNEKRGYPQFSFLAKAPLVFIREDDGLYECVPPGMQVQDFISPKELIPTTQESSEPDQKNDEPGIIEVLIPKPVVVIAAKKTADIVSRVVSPTTVVEPPLLNNLAATTRDPLVEAGVTRDSVASYFRQKNAYAPSA